jgi:transketolase
MGAILNGMALHGGLRVFGSTFLVFSDYMRPAIRLSALMKLPVIYIFTHDSIALGEDGPTHQPIEHIMSLRSIPNTTVFRPADAKETAIAWLEALKRTDGPSVLILTRQKLPVLEGVHKGAHMGAYILRKENKEVPDVILIGTGSEISLLDNAHRELKKEGIEARVVSMLSWEIFDKQSQSYSEHVLPPQVKKRLVVEAGIPLGWERYIGKEGKIIGINRFGASAPGPVLMEKFGFTVNNIIKHVKEML